MSITQAYQPPRSVSLGNRIVHHLPPSFIPPTDTSPSMQHLLLQPPSRCQPSLHTFNRKHLPSIIHHNIIAHTKLLQLKINISIPVVQHCPWCGLPGSAVHPPSFSLSTAVLHSQLSTFSNLTISPIPPTLERDSQRLEVGGFWVQQNPWLDYACAHSVFLYASGRERSKREFQTDNFPLTSVRAFLSFTFPSYFHPSPFLSFFNTYLLTKKFLS